jgi:hypothetical protein
MENRNAFCAGRRACLWEYRVSKARHRVAAVAATNSRRRMCPSLQGPRLWGRSLAPCGETVMTAIGPFPHHASLIRTRPPKLDATAVRTTLANLSTR